MATSKLYQVGADGAGRVDLDAAVLRQVYAELRVWAARRRRELAREQQAGGTEGAWQSERVQP